MTDEQKLACPNCGARNSHGPFCISGPDDWAVSCEECNMGTCGRTEAEALAAWQTPHARQDERRLVLEYAEAVLNTLIMDIFTHKVQSIPQALDYTTILLAMPESVGPLGIQHHIASALSAIREPKP